MTNFMNVAFWLSLTGTLGIVLWSYGESRSTVRLLFWSALLAASGGAYYLLFQSSPHIQPKGEQPDQDVFVVVLYVFMVVGMACNHFYNWLMSPGRQLSSFDWRRFVAPAFVSPLVFYPQLQALQNADLDLTNRKIDMYLFFLAWQNGFFWKQILDSRQKEQKP